MMELDIVASIYYLLTRLRTDGGLGCYLLLTKLRESHWLWFASLLHLDPESPPWFPAVGVRSSGESE